VLIRLTDYDAPELPECLHERMWAEGAKLELERIIGQIKLELVPCAAVCGGPHRQQAADGAHDQAELRLGVCVPAKLVPGPHEIGANRPARGLTASCT